jgi:hypothetical protein
MFYGFMVLWFYGFMVSCCLFFDFWRFFLFVFFSFCFFLPKAKITRKNGGLRVHFFFDLLYLKKGSSPPAKKQKKRKLARRTSKTCCMHSVRDAAEADLRAAIAEPKGPKPERRRPAGL